MPRAFQATYYTSCASCGSRIHPGDLIVPDDEDGHGGGWMHLQCTDTPDDVTTPEPCEKCWLTVCDCGKDL